jgi:hypothetical protein
MNNIRENINIDNNYLNEFDSFTYGDEFYEKLEGLRNNNIESENNVFDNIGSVFGPTYQFKDMTEQKELDILYEREKEFNTRKEREEKEIEEKMKEIEEREKNIKSIKEENDYLAKKNSDLLEDKDINSEFLCVICLSDTKNCLLEPCGHLATCLSCYTEGKLKTCPCCRTTITKMRKIFI